MTTSSNNSNNHVNNNPNANQSAGFSPITGPIQSALAAYLQKEKIDMSSLSPEKRDQVLDQFFQTHYKNDAELLSDDVNRAEVGKENYFLDEILKDPSISAYTESSQGDLPYTQGLIATILSKVSQLSGLPAGLLQDIQKIQEEHKNSPLSSLNVLRTKLQSAIDAYDAERNESVSAQDALTPEQKQQISNTSISNADILETLKTEDLIDEEQYTTIKTKNYAERSPERKKVRATQLRKQFTHTYLNSVESAKSVGTGMQGLVALPTIENVFSSYAKKLGISYDQMLDQSKPEINFSTWSQEEKQALMNTMVEEYYLPNAQKFGAKLGLDVQQYESFVRQLFSLDTKELVIPGQGDNQIKLKFIKKDINARIPVEGMDQSRMEELIPLDFVLDASDDHEMEKLSATMPGKKRYTIHGIQHIDPQQLLSVQVNGAAVDGYSYKIIHNGQEKYVITQEYIDYGKHTQDTSVLTKDGTYKALSTTQEDEVIMLGMHKSAENDAYVLGKKEPLVHSLQSPDISGLLTAYCLNNTTNLSEEDKAKLFAPTPIEPKLDEFFKDGMLGKNPENEERLKDQEQKEGETPEQFEARVAKEKADGMATWNNLAGVKGTSFQKGTQLAIQNVESIFKDMAGNGGYTMLEIIDADDRQNPTRFKYKVLGGMETDINDESGSSLTGQVSERLPFTKDFFDKLKEYGNGSLYKFPPQNDVGHLLDYPKMFDFDNPGMNEIAAKFAKLEKDGDGLKRDKNPIKYFGMGITTYNDAGDGNDTYVMLSTKFSNDGVTVTDKDGKYKKTMSYTEFVLFAADKGLNPYTQKDYDELVGPPDGRHGKSSTAVFMMSPMNIIEGVKKYRQGTIVDGAKRSNERRADKIEEMFYTSGITQHLGNIPFRGEYFVQAQDSYDGKLADKNHKIIMEGDATMNQRGKKMVRGKQTFLDNHNLKGRRRQSCLDYIEEKFQKAQNGTLTDVDRREAFAGLLYVLDKFQITYPRTLSKYAGQHLWPRLLLSEEKFKVYMEGFNDAKAKLEAGVAEGENVRELTANVMEYDVKNMSELMKDEYHRFLYGYKSIPVLQEHSGKRSTDVARNDGAQAAGHHPAFMRAYKEEIELKLRYGQYSYAIGALIQLSKRKEISVPQYYRLWMGAVLKIMLSGGMKYVANKSDKKLLRDMLRKHGIPIANFILDNSRGAEDLAMMLDVISKRANPKGKSFSEGTGWNTSLTAYETWSKPKNFNDKRDFGASQTFNKNFDRWFMGEGNAAKILPFLENSNLNEALNMATIAKDPTLSGPEKSVVDRYLNYSLNANNTRDFDAYRGAEDFVQNLIQERTVFNTSRWLVQEEYMNYSKGSFGKNEEMVGYFRQALRNQANKYAAADRLPRESLKLVLTKYYSMFQKEYGGEHQWFAIMLAYMKQAKSMKERRYYAKAGIREYIRKNNYGSFPPMMGEAFEAIEKLFCNHIDGVDNDMIEEVFGFSDLEATDSQRESAIQTFKDMQNPFFRKRHDPEVQDYIHDLFADRKQGSKNFTGFTESYKSTRKGGNTFDDFQGATAQMDAEMQEQEAQAQEREKAAADEQAQQEQEQKRKEEERRRKEQEDQERKEREEQEAQAQAA